MLDSLRIASRELRRARLSSVAAVTSIALGIAATTAVLSVADAVLWRPLPYAQPNRLVVANVELRTRRTRELPLSGPDFLELRAGTRATLEDCAAVVTTRTLLAEADGTFAQIRLAIASPNILRVLRKSIALGRDFTDADGAPLAAQSAAAVPALQRQSSVAILSHEYWIRRYGGNSNVLGQRVSTANGTGALVVGVLAPGAELILPPRLAVERLPDVWVSARITSDASQRAVFTYRVIARLKEGITVDQARVNVEAVASALRRAFPVWQSGDFHISLEPLTSYVVAQIAPGLRVLIGAAVCLLLIACANVASLLVVRWSYQQRDFALRSSLGANRLRLVRHLLVYAFLIVVVGTIVGAGGGWIGVRLLMSIAPSDLPRIDAVAFNAATLGYTLVLGVAAAALVGLLPALRASRINVATLLRGGPAASMLRVGRVVHAIVVAEIATSFVLLLGAGLMLRSFVAMQRIDPGFSTQGILTFQVIGTRPTAAEQRQARTADIYNRLAAIPGVNGVTAASGLPLADPFYPVRWGRDDALVDESKFQSADYQIVLPGYFETFTSSVLAGRAFSAVDNDPQRAVALIDETLARKAFGSERAAVGRRILVRIRTPTPEWVEVIGIVRHHRTSSLSDIGREQIYLTDGFLGHGAITRWAVRTTADPAGYTGAVRAAVAAVSRQLVVEDVQPMDAWLQRSKATTRFAFTLITVLACSALVLTLVGIYGVLSTVVRRRTAEIGTRMACGAERRHILTLVVRQGLFLGAMGITLGLVGAAGLTRLMTTLLVGIEPTDEVTFVATIVVYAVMAVAACLIPAVRAANLDPVVALRCE